MFLLKAIMFPSLLVMFNIMEKWKNYTTQLGPKSPEAELLRNRAYNFYREMHFSAKRGLAIACRLSVCDVGDL